MTIENASIARPQLGSPSPTIPKRVLEAQRAYRNGEISLAEAERRVSGGKPRPDASLAESQRKRAALDGLRKRLEHFERTGR